MKLSLLKIKSNSRKIAVLQFQMKVRVLLTNPKKSYQTQPAKFILMSQLLQKLSSMR